MPKRNVRASFFQPARITSEIKNTQLTYGLQTLIFYTPANIFKIATNSISTDDQIGATSLTRTSP